MRQRKSQVVYRMPGNVLQSLSNSIETTKIENPLKHKWAGIIFLPICWLNKNRTPRKVALQEKSGYYFLILVFVG